MMKKVLVPTDFTRKLRSAEPFLLEIANHFGAHITMLHAYDMVSSASTFKSVDRYMREDAAQEMLQIIREIEPKLSGGSTINSKVVQGEVISAIVDVAEKEDYDLILMGIDGAEGLEALLVGSHSNKVINRTFKPVLTVPEGFSFEGFQTIVMAVDGLRISSEEVLKPLLAILQVFPVHLVIYHKDTGDGDAPDMDEYFKGISYERVNDQVEDDESLAESIAEFADARNADLLVVLRREKNFFQRLLQGSVTSKMIFESHVPLLVLHDSGE